MIRQIIAFTGALAAFYAYLVFVSDSVPIDARLTVNFAVVPLGIGLLMALAMTARLSRCVLFAALVPVLPVVLFGGDSAKPGMELMIIPPLAVMFAIGSAVGFFIRNRLRPHRTR